MKKLAFLGPHGTNSEEAAIYMANLRKEKMNLVAYNTIQDAIQAVAQKDVDYCLVPVENSIEGSVRITLDTLAHDVDLMIESELIWSVHNQLLTKNPNAKIHTIISHIQPLAQCREYLKSHYPTAKTESVSSTARAAEKASCYGDGYAAIATKTAADLYNLQIIDTDIQDVEDNFTRFICIRCNISIFYSFDFSVLPGIFIISVQNISLCAFCLCPLKRKVFPLLLFRNITYIPRSSLDSHCITPLTVLVCIYSG